LFLAVVPDMVSLDVFLLCRESCRDPGRRLVWRNIATVCFQKVSSVVLSSVSCVDRQWSCYVRRWFSNRLRRRCRRLCLGLLDTFHSWSARQEL